MFSANTLNVAQHPSIFSTLNTVEHVVEFYNRTLSLNEEDIMFKKGDHINIDFILLPWGDGIETTDENVQYVRQDSVFNPIKIILQIEYNIYL